MLIEAINTGSERPTTALRKAIQTFTSNLLNSLWCLCIGGSFFIHKILFHSINLVLLSIL